jgi:hypothetical protein
MHHGLKVGRLPLIYFIFVDYKRKVEVDIVHARVQLENQDGELLDKSYAKGPTTDVETVTGLESVAMIADWTRFTTSTRVFSLPSTLKLSRSIQFAQTVKRNQKKLIPQVQFTTYDGDAENVQNNMPMKLHSSSLLLEIISCRLIHLCLLLESIPSHLENIPSHCY